MKKNRFIAAVLALSCAFGSMAFAAEGTEPTNAPDSAVEATAEPSAAEAAAEQATEAASAAPSEAATAQATEAATAAPTPTPTIDVNAPKLYERPAFIPAPTAEPTATPTATAEAAATETASAAPSEAATAAPTATPTATPTAAPTATPTPLPAKQSVTLKSLLGVASLTSKYTDTYYADIKAAVVDISGSNYTYGKEYDAAYKDAALTEKQFKNLMAGYVEETLAELNATASGSTFYSILSNISIRISPAASVTTTPVFEKKAADNESAAEWYYFPEYTKTTSITAPTAAPTAKPTSTPKPSSQTDKDSGSGSGRKSSGGSGSQIATGVNAGSSSTAATGSYSIGGFTDLGSVPWAQTAITALSAKGIINGRSDSVFDPNANITRAEFAKIVCTALNISDNGNDRQFSDVSSSDWFYPYVRIAAGNGIVNGVSDTAFDPNAVIKREDMAAMLYRAINVSGKSLPAGAAKSFADEGSINDYAKESVSALSAAGVINGLSDTEFSPASTATRAQSAAIIYQYFTAAGIK